LDIFIIVTESKPSLIFMPYFRPRDFSISCDWCDVFVYSRL